MAHILHVAFMHRGASEADRWRAVRIAGGPTRKCPTGESNMRPEAESPDGDNRGLLQINIVHLGTKKRPGIIRAMGFTWDDMLKPKPNAEVGAALWQARVRAGKSGFGIWACA